MASGKRGSRATGTPDGTSRRPQPPIIDLKAEQASSESQPGGSSEGAASAAPGQPSSVEAAEVSLAGDTPLAAAGEPAAGPEQAAGRAAASEAEPSEEPATPSDRTATAEARSAPAGNSREANIDAAAPPSDAPPAARAPVAMSSMLLSAGIGAAAASLVAIGVTMGLWKVGVVSARDDRVPSLALRVNEIERQGRQLAERPTLDVKVAEIEAQANQRSDALQARIAAGEEALARAKGLEAWLNSNLAPRLAKIEHALPVGEEALARVKGLGEWLTSDAVVQNLPGLASGVRALGQAQELAVRMENLEKNAGAGPQALAEVKGLQAWLNSDTVIQNLPGLASGVQALAQTHDLANRLTNVEKVVGAGEQALAQVKVLEAKLSSGTVGQNTPAAPNPAVVERLAATDATARSLADGADALRKRTDEIAATARAAHETAEQAAGALAATKAEMTDDIVGLVQRLAAFETALGEMREALAAAATATKAEFVNDIAGLGQRFASLETALGGIRASLAQATAPDVDRPARFAFAALALRDAVERAVPFAPELAALKPMVADAALLQPLEPFAATGVPSAAQLAHELSSLRTGARPQPEADATGAGMLDRLQTGAAKLVRIRPTDGPTQAEGGGIASIEAQAARGDIPGALAALAKLPQADRAAAEAWMQKAQARTDAVARARQLAQQGLQAIAKPAGAAQQ